MRWELVVALVAGSLIIFFLFIGGVEVTTATIWDGTKPLQTIDLSKMKQARQGSIIVYFLQEYQGLAEEIAANLGWSWLFIERKLGLKLGSFGIALIEVLEEQIGGVYIKQMGGILRSPTPPIPQPIPPGLQSLKSAELGIQVSIYWALPHEAVHMAARRDIRWGFDRQTRGLEEGLAEYIGYLIAKELSPEGHKLMLEKRREQVQRVLRQREHPTYNLLQEFQGHLEFFTGSRLLSPEGLTPEEIAGYGISLAFWLQLVQKHGEGVIKTFWQRISKRGFPNAKEAARILSELTGEDIWAKLQNMDLHEVLRTLEEAAGAPAGS